MIRRPSPLLLAALLLALPSIAAEPAGPVAGDRLSGYQFLTPETRALQDDDFANPGLLWVQQGEKLWSEPAGAAKRSCADCHHEPERMRGVAARYPAFEPAEGRVINLEQRINRCRAQHQNAPELAYESQPLLALTALIGRQSRGLPVAARIDGPAAASYERGRRFFYTRRGQLDLACSSCHEDNVGRHLRGEPISQGQTNGFPIYRQLWQTLGSTHRMFAWCNEAVRAEPFPAGSQDYVDLELFERWRSRGLAVETPAVRR
jgi:sulfur-oxidizing protein SoxA